MAEFLSETKLAFFETQSIKKNYGVAHSHYMSPEFHKSLQHLVCLVFSIDILNLYKVLFVKFSECLKAHQSCERVPK